MPVEICNRTTIAYDSVGDGDAVVLIHGSWAERQTWGFITPGLAESFRVVSYDRRGHAESAAPPDVGTVHDDVADAAALIEVLDLAPAHLVANSYGAIVALRLAAERPELVGRLVCHEPPMLGILDASPEDRPLADEQLRGLGEVRARLERGDDAEGAEYFVEHVALGPGMWAQLPPPMQEMFVRNAPTFLGELRDPDALRADVGSLSQITAPVLLSQGDQSPAMFAPIIELLMGVVPDVHQCTVEGAGHVPHMTHPDDYLPVVRTFLLEERAAGEDS